MAARAQGCRTHSRPARGRAWRRMHGHACARGCTAVQHTAESMRTRGGPACGSAEERKHVGTQAHECRAHGRMGTHPHARQDSAWHSAWQRRPAQVSARVGTHANDRGAARGGANTRVQDAQQDSAWEGVAAHAWVCMRTRTHGSQAHGSACVGMHASACTRCHTQPHAWQDRAWQRVAA